MGSSKMSRSGSSRMAWASPSRWRIPREYFPTCLGLSGSRPTVSMAQRTRSFPTWRRMSARNFKFR